eukprot:1903027-Amphidinium_carterae.1
MLAPRNGGDQKATRSNGTEAGQQACGNAATQQGRWKRSTQGRWQVFTVQVCWLGYCTHCKKYNKGFKPACYNCEWARPQAEGPGKPVPPTTAFAL